MENDATIQLKTLLQLHLATDISSAQNLPYILDILTSEHLAPSPHLTKWTSRIYSLLHSKDVPGKWAGLCLAHRTSLLSKSVMIEQAQQWLTIALRILTRKEAVPVFKAAVNLCRIILCSAMDVSEFQRQVCLPNVTKFTQTIIALCDGASGEPDLEFKILILNTLARIVPLYPNAHRSSHTTLSGLCLLYLNGSALLPTSMALLRSSSRLYAVLPATGGKVGASNLWKKTVEETLAFGWTAFSSLRSSFSEGPVSRNEDAHITISLNLDRLRCFVVIIDDLLGTGTQRPVQVPIGSLQKFAIALLTSTAADRGSNIGHVDVSTRSLEASVVPTLWKLGCEFVTSLATHLRHHLTPHLNGLTSCLASHLEQKPAGSQRLPFLDALNSIFAHCLPLHSEVSCNRLTKAVLSSITTILPSQSDFDQSTDTIQTGRNKKGKKRARAYEGEELFRVSRNVLFSLSDDGKAVLTACDALAFLLRNPGLSAATHSLSVRVLLSILFFLPQRSPLSLSPDPTLHPKLLQKIQALVTESGCGTTNTASKSLGLVLRAVDLSKTDDNVCQRTLDILLHPRVPPLVRSLPHVETLSLFLSEESTEEARDRELLGLSVLQRQASDPVQNTVASPSPRVGLEQETHPVRSIPPAKVPAPIPIDTPPPAKVGDSLPRAEPVYAPSKPSHPPPTAPTLEPPTNATIEPAVMIVDAVEEDQEMPAIDLDSDSDSASD
ncbi:rRNA processing/ribosome biogenesis-domain-containing protein [Desarmillaria tabescens]|uniref:Pre-rRNA-processing protein RIX1 n=1 Tax=Armillaria tabescens TaxID=1929756 RepID=A0AA39NM07_ARMTA|nr:rRNA processing/ribosome biogenesis-domain-containing protein [Desarmillaria tabescens]KAK0468123.1 rRNA processing/ribosome biogenesis-domain-containing protein [Desarmillaria tabescens]